LIASVLALVSAVGTVAVITPTPKRAGIEVLSPTWHCREQIFFCGRHRIDCD
jgi:hypothetical protein